jgi:hypothetical protein
MYRMIFAAVAALAVGTVGGLALAPAKSPSEPALHVQTATIASPVVLPNPGPDRGAAAAPRRTAQVATPTPTPKASPAPTARPDREPEATPDDKPEIRFDGDRVSVRFGKFKIDF